MVTISEALARALEHQQAGRLQAAERIYRSVLEIAPYEGYALRNLGIVLFRQGQVGDAALCFQQVLQLDPDSADAHNDLGTALRAQGHLAEAIACYQRALEINPDSAGIQNNLGNAWKDHGRLPEAIACYRQALKLKPDFSQAHSNLVYTLHCCADYDAQAIFAEHRRWHELHAKPLARFIKPHDNDPAPDRRLRIGYVSPDFTFHPVGRFLLPLLAEHNHELVEVFCYASVRTPNEITDRCRTHAGVWHDVLGFSDEQVAQAIRRDRIDILIDLTMHMDHNRMLVFARKPAPVQVTYLAYCGTTGLDTMDYRLSDPYLDPTERDETIYAEKTIRLPQTYWCYRPPIATPEVNALPALEARHVTFGCLNNFCKVTEPTLAAWSHILDALPAARLLLHAKTGNHRDQVRDFFKHHRVAPERLMFVEQASLSEYFRIYERIDVGLDPFPYGGGTTTCDALWMGVPVVTLAGPTAVGRSGLSILSNVGLTDLLANNSGHYVQIAAALARDLPRLSEIRATMCARMQASPLMDAPRFARDIEAAYRDMWQRWCREKMKNEERRIENEE